MKLKSARGRISVEVGAYEEESGGGVEQHGGLMRVHCDESGEDRIQTKVVGTWEATWMAVVSCKLARRDF
jgi:hypothetical protein